MVRFSLNHVIRQFAAAAVLACSANSLAAQGTTGKIEGTVRDQAGAPVAGAQVLIVGSAFAGATNEQGYYFINNVPAGVVTLRAQYIGYAPAEARGVRVLAGQTHTQNLTLAQQAVTVEGITVEVAANPLVPRDQTTSKPIVQGDVIENLPADAVSQVLRLQPGVVETANGISIRGSRPGQVAVYIDGVLVRSVSGNTGVSGEGTALVGTNSLEEASVTTGSLGAEMGDAQAGVISLVTRAGSSRYAGSLSFATDEVSGQTYGAGVNRVEASFGGPLVRNLTFFLATTLQGAQSARQGKGAEVSPSYVIGGVDTTVTVSTAPNATGAPTDSETVVIPQFVRYGSGARRPNQANDAWTMDAKLQYSYGTGSRLSVTFHRAREQGRFNFGFNPQAARGGLNTSRALIFNWSQNLARSSERAVFLQANLSFQTDRSIAGLLDPQWAYEHRDPFGNFTFSSMQFVTDFDNFPVDDQLVRNLRLNNCDPATGGRCIPYLGRNDFAPIGAYRYSPYGTFAASSGVGVGGPTLFEEQRVNGNAQLDWQANRYNRIKAGGDFWRANSANYLGGSLISMIFLDANRYEPSKLGLFLTDRLDLGDVVIDLGLRYDRLNAGAIFPRTPGRVFTDPLRVADGNLANALADARTAEDSAVANRCNDLRVAGDSAGWSTCNFFTAAPRSAVTPRIGVSFPVTDRTGFRLSYAQQVQSPDFGTLTSGVNTDLAFTNTNNVFGRDLDFGKTIQFEFGARHAFSDNAVLDIAAYNRDHVSEFSARIFPVFDPFRGEDQNINLLTNADFGNSRGIDVKLDMRAGSLFQGSVAYTFESARSTGSNPFEYLNTYSRQISAVTGDRLPPPQALLTTQDNRTHTVAGSLAFNFPNDYRAGTMVGSLLENTGLFATFRFASGLPYTRIDNATPTGARGPGNGFGLVATGLETLNSSTMPWIKNVDLRVMRGFRVAGNNLQVFADFRNLFNWTNLVQIFAGTGDVVNDKFRDEQVIQPILDALRAEASNVLETRTVNGVAVEGYNLSDCGPGAYRSATASVGDRYSTANCLLVRQTEARFGDGDRFFDLNEQLTAFRAAYDVGNGSWTFRGPGFNMRLGFELAF